MISDFFHSEHAKITPDVGMTPDVAQSYLDELANQGIITKQPNGFIMGDGIASLVTSEFQNLKSPHLDMKVFYGFGTYLFSRILEEESRQLEEESRHQAP